MKKKEMKAEPNPEPLPGPPDLQEGVKFSDHERAAMLLFVDDGRTPHGKNGRANWGDSFLERRRRLVGAVCFDGDFDRADDAIQRLKYLGIVDDEAPCNCAKCQALKGQEGGDEKFPEDMPPELKHFAEALMNSMPKDAPGKLSDAFPKSGMAQMGCAYCGEMWQVDLGKGEKEIQRRAEEHGRKCNKSPLLAELKMGEAMRAALSAIRDTPEYLEASNALGQIKKLATDVLAMLPPREIPPEITG